MTTTQIEDDNHIVFPEPARHFFVAIRDNPGGEKMVIGLTQTTHLTIHFGMKSKVLDVHYTDERFHIGDERRHKTLLEIPHEYLKPLAHHLDNILMPKLLACYTKQRINLGKLGRHHCILSRMTGDDLNNSEWVSIKKKRVKLARSFSNRSLNNLLCRPQELPPVPSSHYMVHSIKHGKLIPQGFIWFPPNNPYRKPFFVKFKDMKQMNSAFLSEFIAKYLELGLYFNNELWEEIIGKKDVSSTCSTHSVN